MVAGAVGVAFHPDDVGVVDETVDQGGGDDRVGQGLAPSGGVEVGCDNDLVDLITGGNELEQQVRLPMVFGHWASLGVCLEWMGNIVVSSRRSIGVRRRI